MSLSLLESAGLLGRMRYVELATFARLGRRARCAVDPEVATFLSGASLAHAWRAAQLEEHLPVSATLPGAAQLTVSPGPHLEAALDLLGPSTPITPELPATPAPPPGPPEEPPGRGADRALVAALATVLYPAMLQGYDARLALASPASDPPLVRTLGRVRHDLATVADAARRLAGAGNPTSGPPAGKDGGGEGAGAAGPERDGRPAALPATLSAALASGGPFGPIESGT